MRLPLSPPSTPHPRLHAACSARHCSGSQHDVNDCTTLPGRLSSHATLRPWRTRCSSLSLQPMTCIAVSMLVRPTGAATDQGAHHHCSQCNPYTSHRKLPAGAARRGRVISSAYLGSCWASGQAATYLHPAPAVVLLCIGWCGMQLQGPPLGQCNSCDCNQRAPSIGRGRLASRRGNSSRCRRT